MKFIYNVFGLLAILRANQFFVQQNPWPEKVYHDPKDGSSTILYFPTYQSLDETTLIDQLKLICLGCDDVTGVKHDIQNNRIVIKSNDYGKEFNITLLTLWKNNTEAFAPLKTTVKIEEKPNFECEDAIQLNFETIWFVQHKYVQETAVYSDTPIPILLTKSGHQCKLQFRCKNCIFDSGIVVEINESTSALRVQTQNVPDSDEVVREIEVWLIEQQKFVIPFKILLSCQEKFVKDSITSNPKRNLATCSSSTNEMFVWITPWFGWNTIYYYLGTGNITITLPSAASNAGCFVGTPNLEYQDPQNYIFYNASDCRPPQSAASGTYSTATQQWSCPLGFQINILPWMWTNGYELRINSNEASLQLGYAYLFEYYIYGNSTSNYLDDAFYVEFLTCNSNGLITETPSNFFTANYLIELNQNLVIPFWPNNNWNPCNYTILLDHYTVNGTINATYAWLAKNPNDFTIAPSLMSQIGNYSFIAYLKMTDCCGVVSTLTGSFILTISSITACISTTDEMFAWITPTFNSTTIQYQLGTGNYTITLPSAVSNAGCFVGTPDVNYQGPEGSFGASDCYPPLSATSGTYSTATQQWSCPSGFEINSLQWMWTNGYELRINSNYAGLQLGSNKYWFQYSIAGNVSWIFDYFYLEFLPCNQPVGVITQTPSPCFTTNYLIGLTSSLLIPFCSITFTNPCNYPVVFDHYTVNGTINSTYAWLTKNPNDYTIAPTLPSQIGTYQFITYWSITDNYGVVTTVTGNFIFKIFCNLITATSTPTSNSMTYTATLNTAFVIPSPTWVQSPSCAYIFTRSNYSVNGVLNFAASWFTPSSNTVLSTSAFDRGTYNFDEVYSVTDSQGVIQTFNYSFVLVIDPCFAATYVSPSMANLTLCYLCIAENYSWQAFQDSISIALSQTEQCGTWTYQWSPNTLATYQTDITQTFVSSLQFSFQWTSGLLTDFTLGVPYISTIQGYLNGIYKISADFYVTFACAISSITTNYIMSHQILTYTIGDSAVVFNFPTFIQTPNCSLNLEQSIFIDDMTAQPAWFTYVPNTTFTVFTADTSFSGTHNVTIQTNWSPISYTNTQSVIFTFVDDPCLTTTWNSNSISNITTSILSSLVQSFTQFTTVCTICGPVNYVISPSQTFVTLDTNLFQITVASANVSDVGFYQQSLTGSLSNYPNVPPLIVNFTVNITPCVVTSLTPSNNLNQTSPVQITIFDIAKLITLASYIQTPACNYTPIITLDGDSYPVSTSFVSYPFWINQNNVTGAIQSNDYSLHGLQFQLRQTTTIGFFSQQFVTRVYNFMDPCALTSLIPINLTNIDPYISADPLSVTIPWLNDTKSLQYPSNNIYQACYTQNLTITENGMSIQFATLINNLWTVQTNDISKAGNHTISVTYQMTRYPANIITLSFNLRLFSIDSCSTTSWNSNQMTNITVSTLSSLIQQFTPFTTVYNLCGPVNYVINPPQTFITLDTINYRMTVASSDVSEVGIYYESLIGTLVNYPSFPALILNFTVTVNPQTIGSFQVLTGKVQNQTYTVGQTYNQSVQIEHFNVISSSQLISNDSVEYSIQILSETQNASTSFINFDSKSLTINWVTNDTKNIGNYRIKVIGSINNLLKNYIVSLEFYLIVLPQIVYFSNATESAISNITNNTIFLLGYQKAVQNGLNQKNNVQPIAKIDKISRTGQVNISFSQPMFVPQNISIFKKTDLTEDKIPPLQLSILVSNERDIKYFNFTYQIVNFTEKLMTLQLNFENELYITKSTEDPDILQCNFTASFFFTQNGQFWLITQQDFINLYHGKHQKMKKFQKQFKRLETYQRVLQVLRLQLTQFYLLLYNNFGHLQRHNKLQSIYLCLICGFQVMLLCFSARFSQSLCQIQYQLNGFIKNLNLLRLNQQIQILRQLVLNRQTS